MDFYHLDVLAYHVAAKLAEAPALPHTILTYKTVADDSMEVPQQEPPFVMIRAARQVGPVGAPSGYSYVHPFIDQTRAAIWIVSPLVWPDGAERKGGFDAIHHPAFRRLKELVEKNQALEIPADLHAEYKTGTVGLRMDPITGQDHSRLPDLQQERSVIFAVLYQHKTGGK